MDITAKCICGIHCVALDGFDLNTFHKLIIEEKKWRSGDSNLGPLGFPEARMLPLCYSAPHSYIFHLIPPPHDLEVVDQLADVGHVVVLAAPQVDDVDDRVVRKTHFVIRCSGQIGQLLPLRNVLAEALDLKTKRIFLKMGHSQPLFHYYHLFCCTIGT